MKSKDDKYEEAVSRNLRYLHNHITRGLGDHPSWPATRLVPHIKHKLGIQQADTRSDRDITTAIESQRAAP
jgi:hypothetical protein